MMHLLGHAGKQVGDLQSRHRRVDRLRRPAELRPRVRIPRLQLTRPARHPQDDYRPRPFASALCGRPQIESRQRERHAEPRRQPQHVPTTHRCLQHVVLVGHLTTPRCIQT